MKVDVLTAEIGSTTTVVNALSGVGTAEPRLAGQGFAPTTVLEGDVTTGLYRAMENLKKTLHTTDLSWSRFLERSTTDQ